MHKNSFVSCSTGRAFNLDWLSNRDDIWADFDGMIFVECKNWSRRVGADEIRNFKGKLENNGIHAGILVAVNGVMGEGSNGAYRMGD